MINKSKQRVMSKARTIVIAIIKAELLAFKMKSTPSISTFIAYTPELAYLRSEIERARRIPAQVFGLNGRIDRRRSRRYFRNQPKPFATLSINYANN